MPSSTWLDKSKFATAKEGVFPYSVSMLSWALNEEEGIEAFLKRAKEFLDKMNVEYEHILLDDGSTDKTLEIARAAQSWYPNLKIIKNPKNLGSGWCTRIAVGAATKDILFWQTADWSYDIRPVPSYLWLLKDYDMVQGVRVSSANSQQERLLHKRYLLTGRHMVERSDDVVKAFISVTNYLLVRFLFRIRLLDFQNVTLYPTKLAQSLELESHSSFTNPEMLFKAYWKGASIQQMPIHFLPREVGDAKGTKFRYLVAAIFQIFRFWIRWIVLGKRPDKKRGRILLP